MSTFIMIFKMFEVIASLQCLVKSMCFNKMATVHCGSEGISAFMHALRIFSFATLGILSLAALWILRLAAFGFSALLPWGSSALLPWGYSALLPRRGLFSSAAQREDYSSWLPRERTIQLVCPERGIFSLVAQKRTSALLTASKGKVCQVQEHKLFLLLECLSKI